MRRALPFLRADEVTRPLKVFHAPLTRPSAVTAGEAAGQLGSLHGSPVGSLGSQIPGAKVANLMDQFVENNGASRAEVVSKRMNSQIGSYQMRSKSMKIIKMFAVKHKSDEETKLPFLILDPQVPGPRFLPFALPDSP